MPFHYSNQLLQKVRRHGRMAVLFHSHNPALSEPPSRMSSGIDQLHRPQMEGVVKAYLLSAIERESWLGGNEGAFHSALAENRPPAGSQLQPKAGLAAPAAPSAPIIFPSVRADDSRDVSTQSGLQATPQTDDRTWKRLQTIFRKHQEAQDPIHESTTPAQTTEVQRLTASSQETTFLEPASDVVEDLPSRPDQSAPDSTPPMPPIDRAGPRTADVGSPAGSGTAGPVQRMAAPPELGRIVQASSSLPPALQRSAGSEFPTRPTPRVELAKPGEPSQPIPLSSGHLVQRKTSTEIFHAEPGPSENISFKQDEGQVGYSDPDTSPRVPLQPQPLQDAWPVQRREAAIPETSGWEPLPFTNNPSQASLQQTVQAALQPVAPGQPTESSIELVLTRGPRPEFKPFATQDVLPRVSRKPDPHIAESPAVQRKEESVASPSALPDEVQTEIGPLPGDLWELIDQPRPKPQGEPTPRADHGSPSGQLIPPASKPDFIEPSQMTADHAIQRQIAPERAETRQREIPQAQPKTDQPVENEIDLDDLTRQVYMEIRNRLAIEANRKGKRF